MCAYDEQISALTRDLAWKKHYLALARWDNLMWMGHPDLPEWSFELMCTFRTYKSMRLTIDIYFWISKIAKTSNFVQDQKNTTPKNILSQSNYVNCLQSNKDRFSACWFFSFSCVFCICRISAYLHSNFHHNADCFKIQILKDLNKIKIETISNIKFLIVACKTSLLLLKGTLMQIWKFRYMFVFI